MIGGSVISGNPSIDHNRSLLSNGGVAPKWIASIFGGAAEILSRVERNRWDPR
jgi:hypothetical protein